MSSSGYKDRFIDRIVGRYRLREKIGSGGMGSVYRGVHIEIPGLVVAVKLLALNLVNEDSLRQRFRDEAAFMALLGECSPNIVQIRDYGIFEEFDIPYYMMELLQGHSLEALNHSDQPVPLERLISIVSQLCDGLHVAHSQDVIHRDLKPPNIFLIPDPQLGDRVKILDFGIAKLINDAEATRKTVGYIGTPQYSSPEQFLSQPLDLRSDLYSLGVILYELFSGTRPYEAVDNSFASWYRIHTELPPPKQVPSQNPSHPTPPEIEQIILRCLSKNPNGRPDSALEIAKYMQLALKDLRIQKDQLLLSDAARLANIQDWRNAIARVEAISYESPLYVEAQIALRTWQPAAANQQALEQARRLAVGGQIDDLVRAVSLVVAIPKDSAIQQAAQSEATVWVNQAFALVEEYGRTGRWAEAIASAQQVCELPGASQRFDDRVVQWRNELSAAEALSIAESLAARQQWDQALHQAESVQSNTSVHTRAHELRGLWQRELEAKQRWEQAQRFADAGEFTKAIEWATTIDAGTANVEAARSSIVQWQNAMAQARHWQTLEQARARIRTDGVAHLAEAVSLVSTIPVGLPLYQTAQNEMGTWIAGALAALEKLAAERRWAEALEQAQPVAAIPAVGQRLQGQMLRWQTELSAAETLGTAESFAARQQWDQALRQSEILPPNTDAQIRASDLRTRWRRELQAQQLWEQAELLANVGDYSEALRLASGVESGTVYEGIARNRTATWQQAAAQVEHRRSLDEARDSIRIDGIANLARALSLLSSIPYSSDLYITAQSEANGWIESAIGAAEQLATEQRWAEALQLVAPLARLNPVAQRLGNRPSQWQQELQAQQALEQAEQLAQAEEYDAAIDRATKIVEGMVCSAIARTRIADWREASRRRPPTQLFQEEIPEFTDTASATDENPTRLQAEELASAPHLPDSHVTIQQTTQDRPRQTLPSDNTQLTRTAPWVFVAAGTAVLVLGGGTIALFAPKTPPANDAKVKTESSRKVIPPPVTQMPQQPTRTQTSNEQSKREAARQAAIHKAGEERRQAEEVARKEKDEADKRQPTESEPKKLATAARLEEEAKQRELIQKQKAAEAEKRRQELAKLQDEASKHQAEEEAKQKAAEAEKRRQNELAKIQMDEANKRQAEEEAKQKAAEAEKRRQNELAKIQMEEEKKRRAEEEAKKQAEEIARRQASVESSNRRTEQEATATTQNSTNSTESLIPGKTCRYKRQQNKNLAKLPNCPE
jgi:Protein kinase domain